jgi:very-short-patch-repair endonuclease
MTRWSVDQAIAAIAAKQEGKFARRQVWEVGGDDHLISRHVDARTWVVEAIGTYGFPSVRPTYRGRLWVAHLAVGPASIVSHESAAQLRRVDCFYKGRVTVSVPHGDHPKVPGVRVYQRKDLSSYEQTPVGGLPVVTIPWIFVDMASACSRPRLGLALDTAVTAGQTAYEEVGVCLRKIAKRGKPGVRALTSVLDEHGPGRIPPASQLERELDDLIERFGLRIPKRQYAHPGQQFVTGCVDRAYVNAKLILEADGRRWHMRIQDITRDRERDNDAARAGWQTLRVLREHVLGDPEGTAATIRETYAVRIAQLEAIAVGNRQLLPPE